MKLFANVLFAFLLTIGNYCYGQQNDQFLTDYLIKLYQGFPITKDSKVLAPYIKQHSNFSLRQSIYDSSVFDFVGKLSIDSYEYKPVSADLERFSAYGYNGWDSSYKNKIVMLLTLGYVSSIEARLVPGSLLILQVHYRVIAGWGEICCWPRSKRSHHYPCLCGDDGVRVNKK